MPTNNLDNRIMYGADRFSYNEVPPENGLVTCYTCRNEVHNHNAIFVSSTTIYNPMVSAYPNQPTWIRIRTAVCEDCVEECALCREPALDNCPHNTYHTDHILCPECNENCGNCDRCDRLFHYDDLESFEYGDGSYCHSCYQRVARSCDYCDVVWHEDDDCPCDCEEENNRSNRILNYMAMRNDSDRIFYDIGNDIVFGQRAITINSQRCHIPYMGIEIETESKGNCIDTGASFFDDVINKGHLYLKEDASIDSGFEIVGHPRTLASYHQDFDWSPFKQLSDHGFRSWKQEDIGCHIHISRSSFFTKELHRKSNSSPHMYGFLAFIYNNCNAVEAISGRNSSYGRISDSELENIFSYSRYAGAGARSVAVNTNNKHTLELRCFQGALNKDRILGYLEFVHAVWAYTKSDRLLKLRTNMDFNVFADWASCDDLYGNLTALIERTGARHK